MKHQTGGTGRPTGNILDFHAILAEVWGSYQGLKVGENIVNYTVSGTKRPHKQRIANVTSS